MDPVTLRFVERILAVAIGGIAIYLGYQLFLRVPELRDSQGRVSLPGGITIILSRVGPGIFFALFGAAVVAYALHEAVSFTRETSVPATDQQTVGTRVEIFGGFGPTAARGGGDALDARRLRARRDVEFLNGLPRLLKHDLSDEQLQSVDRLKLAVMASLWAKDWGAYPRFKEWTEGDAHAPVPKGLEAAADYFRAGGEGTK